MYAYLYTSACLRVHLHNFPVVSMHTCVGVTTGGSYLSAGSEFYHMSHAIMQYSILSSCNVIAICLYHTYV